LQAKESGGAGSPEAATHVVRVRDETYAISDARWTRIFPDAAAATAPIAETPASPRRRGLPPPIVIATAAAVVALGAAAALAWSLGVGRPHRPSAPAHAAVPTPPAAPASPATSAPPAASAPSAPAVQPPAPPPPAVPLERPRRKAAALPATHRAWTEHSPQAGAAAAAADESPTASAPRKGNAVSRFFGRLFSRHAAATNSAAADQGR
jgi:hypothetical protein